MDGLSKEKKKFLNQLQTKKGRQKHGLVLAEGPKVVETALQLGGRLHSLYVLKEKNWSGFWSNFFSTTRVPLFFLSPVEFQEISSTLTPQGILGIFEESFVLPETLLSLKPPLVIALDTLQDAGNVGTILRTAHALGISSILSGKNTADVFQPKVVRASAGLLFGLQISPFLDLKETLISFQEKGYQLYTTLARGGKAPEEWKMDSPSVLIFGNEGSGVSEEIQHLSSRAITIPLSPQAESLNVTAAASIILYHSARQLGLL